MATDLAVTGKPQTPRKPRTGKKGQPKAHLTAEQKEHALAMLTENPSVSDSEVSVATGVSRASVYVMRMQIQPAGEEQTDEYGRQLSKRLPMGARVRIWAKLARGRGDPRSAFVQKAALQRVEELIGHVTAKEKRDAEANQSAPGPIFVFAVGSVPSAAPVLTSTPQIEPDNAAPATVTKDKQDGSAT